MALKTFRERSPIVVGILSIIGIAAMVTFAFYLDELPFVKQAYEVKAEFKDAAGLNVDNQVRVAGVKVGTVEDIALVGDRVVVTMEIANDTAVPADAGATIKLATILGTKFVEIEGRGGEPFLQAGDTIPLERTTVPYEIYEAANQGTGVLEEINGPALNRMLTQLSKLLKAAKDEVGVALSGLNRLGSGLNARQDDLRSLLAGAEELTETLAAEDDEIVQLVDASNEVLGTIARKRTEIQTLLANTRFMAGEVTALLRENRGEVDVILRRLHNALVVLAQNVEHLDVALEYAGPSTRYFGSIFQQGRWADIFTCALVISKSCEQD